MDDLHPSFSEKVLAEEAVKFHKMQLRHINETDTKKKMILGTKLQEKRKTLILMKQMITHDVINFDD